MTTDEVDLPMRELARRVARRRWLLGGIFVGVTALVTVYAFLATPRYASEARLRINTQTQAPSALTALADQATSMPGAGLLGLGREELETEVGVLRSERISDAMIDSLALGVRVTKPAASRAAVLSARVVAPDVDVDGKLTLSRRSNGHYGVSRSKLDDVATPSEMAPGVPVRIGGFVITLNPGLAAAGPDEIVIKLLPRYEVHKLLEKRLTIARQEGGSALVEVSFEDPDRRLAAQVVSTLVGEYVAYTTSTSRTEDTISVSRLRTQVDSTARKMATAEAALRAFQEQNRLISPEEQASAEVKRIGTISAHVDAISMERNALARVLTVIDQRSNHGDDPEAFRQIATFPSLITNRGIQDLLQSLLDLENQRAVLGVRRTESNTQYKALSDRISEIEKELYTVGPQYLESLDQQLSTAVRTVSAVTDTAQQIPGMAMQYGRLVRDRTVAETTYLALQKQLKAAELRDVLRQDKVRVVDSPRVANVDDPVFPKKLVMVSLSAVFGLALALFVAVMSELWRDPYAA